MKALKKFPFVILIGAFVAILLVVFDIWYNSWLTVGQFYPMPVSILPEGYVKVEELRENEAFDFIFFERYCSVVDGAGNSLGGGMVTDTSFIVSYRGKYYINTQRIPDPG